VAADAVPGVASRAAARTAVTAVVRAGVRMRNTSGAGWEVNS